jgi:hypothetical protein
MLVMDHSLALDSTLVEKISKRHFFQDIKNFFHGVTGMGLKPNQNFFFKFLFQEIGLFLTKVGGLLP